MLKPLLQKRKKTEVQDIRLISLLPVISKVVEKSTQGQIQVNQITDALFNVCQEGQKANQFLGT